jgi:hypothetical protein
MSIVFSIGDPGDDGVTGLRGDAGTLWSRADCGGLLARAEVYLRSYLSFPDDRYLLPLSLFAVLEHCWQRCFDEVPYLCVSAAIKRSGKTRLLELLAFLAGEDNAIMVDGSITVAALYTEVDLGIVVLIDEAEGLQNPRSPFRPILNGGYRRGQTLMRKIGGQNVYFSIFGPKVFAVIGDVNDSLRDRCIIVEMQRTQSETRMDYVRQIAKEQGTEIAGEISRAVASAAGDIRDAYLNYHERYRSMSFLFDRERELWKPLFAICQIFAPERIEELERCAADIAALKTSPIRRFELLKSEEENARKLEYAERLLSDALTVIGERDRITTTDLLAGLRAIHTAPWRSYERSGLTETSLAALLDLFHIGPKTIRIKPKSKPRSTAKGYFRADLARLGPDPKVSEVEPDPDLGQMRSSQEVFKV